MNIFNPYIIPIYDYNNFDIIDNICGVHVRYSDIAGLDRREIELSIKCL